MYFLCWDHHKRYRLERKIKTMPSSSCKRLVWYTENLTCIKIACLFSFAHVVFYLGLIVLAYIPTAQIHMHSEHIQEWNFTGILWIPYIPWNLCVDKRYQTSYTIWFPQRLDFIRRHKTWTDWNSVAA